jgi:hypothetical protein
MISNYDFKKIPLWDGTKESFEITADEINGRIPVTRLEAWRDFTELLETDFFNRPNTHLVFRGHRRFDWGLMPTLARIPESGIIDKKLADSQLAHFKRAVRGRLNDNSLVINGEEDELWSVGQHHGLMTPLLDWTYSPYVALFFAFAREDSENEQDNPYRAIYVLNKTFVADDELCPDLRMYEPKKDDHGRLVNQAGLFTFSPYDSTIENTLTNTLADENFEDDELRSASEDEQTGIIARYICKIYINNEDREGCMRHLRRMNVHHASLFPDLIGASEYCNLVVAEERKEYEIESSRARSVIGRANINEKTDRSTSVGRVSIADNDEIAMFAVLLDQVADQTVEKGRVQLIAEKLSSTLSELKTVDWRTRDSIQSEMRAKGRVLLRKYGYPVNLRELAMENVLGYLNTLAEEVSA